jgi:hypothetical protein
MIFPSSSWLPAFPHQPLYGKKVPSVINSAYSSSEAHLIGSLLNKPKSEVIKILGQKGHT